MASSILNSDDGTVSGIAGLKTTGGDDGSLKIQANGVDAISVADTGAVTINTPVTLSGGALGVASGGTGATSLTSNNVLLGNGTSALQVVAPGTNGNVLTSNGTTWTSAAPTGGGGSTSVFTTTVSVANWTQATSSDPWIATKTVTGILSTDRPLVSLDVSGLSISAAVDYQRMWNLLYRAEASANNEVKFYAVAKPFYDFDVVIQVFR